MNKPENETVMIELKHLHPSPTQPRKHFNEEKEGEMILSMKEYGFTLSTLLVRPMGDNGDFEIVVGERRVRAARAAGISDAPCYVRKYSESEVISIQLVENLQRDDLNAIEEAEGYNRALQLLDENQKPVFTIEKLAQQTGKSAITIRRRLTLLRLPAAARTELEAGKLNSLVASMIAAIPDENSREQATQLILHPRDEAEPLSSRRAEILIQQRFVRDLRHAKFNQSDAVLVPIVNDDKGQRAEGGACDDCPFKQCGHHHLCLNPSCFEKKQTAEWQQWQREKTDETKNRQAVTELESRKLFPVGANLTAHNLVDLSDCPDSTDLRPGEVCRTKWRELIGKDSNLLTVISRDRDGKEHELVDRAAAIELARAQHKDLFKSQQNQRSKRVDSDDRKLEEKKREADSAQAKQAIEICADRVRITAADWKLPPAIVKTLEAFFRLLLDRELEFSAFNENFCKRHGLPVVAKGGSVLKQTRKRALPELVAMFIESVISEGGYSYSRELDALDSRWLALFGVNYAKQLKDLKKVAAVQTATDKARVRAVQRADEKARKEARAIKKKVEAKPPKTQPAPAVKPNEEKPTTECWGVTDSKRKRPHVHYFVNDKSLCRGTAMLKKIENGAKGKCPTCVSRLNVKRPF
jgi:ParB/RepB/Spo0J family partition protein